MTLNILTCFLVVLSVLLSAACSGSDQSNATSEISVSLEGGARSDVSAVKSSLLHIETEPENVVAAPGDMVVFSVGVDWEPASIQWFKNDTPIEEGTNEFLRVHAQHILDSGDYHAVVYSREGAAIRSRRATLVLSSAPLPAIIVEDVEHGEVRGTVVGVAPSKYGLFSYINVIGWWSKPTFDAPMSHLLSNGAFSVTTVSGGNDSSAKELRFFLVPSDSSVSLAKGSNSLPANLKRVALAEAIVIKTPETCVAPVLFRQPVGGEVPIGSKIILGVSAAGSDLKYQWIKDELPLFGETDPTLSLNEVRAKDMGGYRVEISNGAGLLVSDTASLRITRDARKSASLGQPEPVHQGEKGTTFDRGIEFAGRSWSVKDSSDFEVGPGGNFFSDKNVWVDALGHLHLRVTKVGNRWVCAEVVLKESLGYGSYRFHLSEGTAQLDSNIVLGLFTWSDDPEGAHREIDVELARWGDSKSDFNAQFVMQPWFEAGHMKRFWIGYDKGPSLQGFDWGSSEIRFASTVVPANQKSTDIITDSWTFSDVEAIAVPGDENVRINLWLHEGNPPNGDGSKEIVIEDFTFE